MSDPSGGYDQGRIIADRDREGMLLVRAGTEVYVKRWVSIARRTAAMSTFSTASRITSGYSNFSLLDIVCAFMFWTRRTY
jgi:hypothetical protein